MRKLLQRLKSQGDRTFIASYLRYAEATESPAIFDLWCALWVIGNMVGRQVYVARPRAPVYLNWYIILVGDSGVVRKSSSVGMATSIIRNWRPSYSDLVEGKVTPEKLEQTLALQTVSHGNAHAIISASELVSLLGRERYTMAMPGLLTDLYDAHKERVSSGSLRHGSLSMQNVFVSLLSASTSAWLATAINPAVIEGGFTSRCIFVTADEPKAKIAWPEENVAAQNSVIVACARLAEWLKDKSALALTERALQLYTRWYNRRQLHDDLYRTSFEAREDAHVLRAAACLAINDHLPEITEQHIETAMELVEDAKKRGYGIFTFEKQASDRLEVGLDVLRAVLIGAGSDGIDGTNLSLRLARYLNGGQLQLALRIMHELALVQRFQLSSHGRGRKKTVWRATKAIMAKDALNVVKGEITKDE